MTATGERLLLIADGKVFGAITPDQAGQCADWLRKHFPHGAMVEFFDGVAEYGSEGRSS